MQAGEVIAIMEAMKMEVQVIAEQQGVVALFATPGTPFQAGDLLGEIHPQ